MIACTLPQTDRRTDRHRQTQTDTQRQPCLVEQGRGLGCLDIYIYIYIYIFRALTCMHACMRAYTHTERHTQRRPCLVEKGGGGLLHRVARDVDIALLPLHLCGRGGGWVDGGEGWLGLWGRGAGRWVGGWIEERVNEEEGTR